MHHPKVPISTQIAELPITEYLSEGKERVTGLLKNAGFIRRDPVLQGIVCPNCSRQIPANAKICRYCGAKVTE